MLLLKAGADRRSRPLVRRAASTLRGGGWLLWLMCLTLGAFVVTLIAPQPGQSEIGGVLQMLVTWIPPIVCVVAVFRTRFRRPETILATAALMGSAFGFTWYGLAFLLTGAAPTSAIPDFGYLIYYALMLAALAVLIRRKLPGLGYSVLLDGAVGSLGAAALLAVVLSPVLDTLLAAPPSVSDAVAYLSPFFDMLIVALIAGMAALQGLDFGRRWRILALGLIVFTAADTIYALQVTAGTFTVGTPLDAGWATAYALIAFWVAGTALPDRAAGHPKISFSALAVPLVATAVGLGILILGNQVRVSPLAVFLASATLVLAAVPLAFRQLVLLRQATTDELTGLPNRRALNAEVPARLAASRGRSSALLLLDLDRFKEVNDTFGHDIGDDLLIAVARRLGGQLSEGDLLVRLGGDEFAIHLRDSNHAEAVEVCLALRSCIAEPFELKEHSVACGISIGIAMFPEEGAELTALLRHADMAMYAAQADLADRPRPSTGHGTEAPATSCTVRELGIALASGQLILHYQPKIDLTTGGLCGVEALVRWNHPTLGLLYPESFLGLTAEWGLMPELTQVVLETALDQAAAWAAEGRDLSVSVNISASALVDPELPSRIGDLIRARGLTPSVLLLEFTEQEVMADFDTACGALARLRTTGIRIALANFGTGYTSLAHLRRLPADELKLDLSLVIPMAKDPQAAAVVASTVALAHSFDLPVVAGGVENFATYAELARYGCDQAQGYYVCRPTSAAGLEHRLAPARSAPAGNGPT